MRELKFRVWDKDSSCMFYIPSIQFGYLGGGDAEDGFPAFYGLRGHSFTDQGGHVFKKENMTILQYTGVEDKNGIEIYEGDITKGVDYTTGIVKFGNGRFYHTGVSQYLGSPYWGEVIGNIYENPELL